MRLSVKRSLTGFLIAGALALSAVSAYAQGNANGPDAFIGIVGGNPGTSVGCIPYNRGGNSALGPNYQNGHGGYGTYDGGYYRGY